MPNRLRLVALGAVLLALVGGLAPSASAQSTQVTQQRAIVAGWNLVSYSLNLPSQRLADVLSNLNGAYDVVYGFDPAQGGTTSYFTDPNKAILNNLQDMAPLQGYWLHATTNGTWTVSGTALPSSTTLTLQPGWNLAGWAGASGASLSASLPLCQNSGSTGCVDTVYAFDPAQGGTVSYFTDPAKAILNNLATMSPASGYWLHTAGTQSVAWSPLLGTTATSSSPLALGLTPTTASTRVGNTLQLAITLDSGHQSIDGLQFHLDFDPAVLQVVDDAGNPTTSLPASSALTFPLLNQVDNTAGRIDYAAGQLTAPFPSGSLTITHVTFKALAATGAQGTTLSFETATGRAPLATFAGSSLPLATPVGATLHVSS